MANKKMTIIASKGSLDMAYPPLILATTAAAMDVDVTIFFTFYGLELIKKGKGTGSRFPPREIPPCRFRCPFQSPLPRFRAWQPLPGAI